ncbi:hypothetical protein BH18GEM1_BH18GEM1_22450 [soil metagenome]
MAAKQSHDALAAAIASLPGDAFVPVAWLRELMGDGVVATTTATMPIDLTVLQVAELLGLSASTVRGYCAAGTLAAYRRAGREWRVPRPAVRAYLDAERERHVADQADDTPSAYTERTSRRIGEGKP